jgi:hypothetical protein
LAYRNSQRVCNQIEIHIAPNPLEKCLNSETYWFQGLMPLAMSVSPCQRVKQSNPLFQTANSLIYAALIPKQWCLVLSPFRISLP